MSHALDRLTSSVSNAVFALNDATARAGSAGQGDDTALGQLADSLEAAVSAWHTVSVVPSLSDQSAVTAAAGEAAPESIAAVSSAAANPLDPNSVA